MLFGFSLLELVFFQSNQGSLRLEEGCGLPRAPATNTLGGCRHAWAGGNKWLLLCVQHSLRDLLVQSYSAWGHLLIYIP